MMAVSDPVTGKVLATPATGLGPDSIAFDDGYAFTPNGQDATITIVGETSPGKFEPVATIPMALRARIIGADQVRHKLYVPAAEYGPGPAAGRGTRTGAAGYFQRRGLQPPAKSRVVA